MSKYTYTLAHPARVSTQKGDNPVHVASFWGNTESLRLLLEDNADANTPNVKVDGARCCCRISSVCRCRFQCSIVIFLVQKVWFNPGMDFWLTTYDRPHCMQEEMTPLMLAVKGGHSESAKLLLENNADPNAQTKVMGRLREHVAVEGSRLFVAVDFNVVL